MLLQRFYGRSTPVRRSFYNGVMSKSSVATVRKYIRNQKKHHGLE